MDPFAEADPRPAGRLLLSCFRSEGSAEDDPYKDNEGPDEQQRHGGTARPARRAGGKGQGEHHPGPAARLLRAIDIPKECWEPLAPSRINVEECMNILCLHGKRHGVNTQGSSSSRARTRPTEACSILQEALGHRQPSAQATHAPLTPRGTRGEGGMGGLHRRRREHSGHRS